MKEDKTLENNPQAQIEAFREGYAENSAGKAGLPKYSNDYGPRQSIKEDDPYEMAGRQMRADYATSIADIRKRRQAMSQRYQPDIDRQKRVMKIMALGKLFGALGQLAGGGRGPVIRDSDPYQINAWRRLEATKAEKKGYERQLDLEEQTARRSMQQGLNRLSLEKSKAAQRMSEMTQKYELELKKMGMNAELKAAIEKIKGENAIALQNAKTANDISKIEANLKAALDKIRAQSAARRGEATHRGQVAMDVDDHKTENKKSYRQFQVNNPITTFNVTGGNVFSNPPASNQSQANTKPPFALSKR